MSTEKQENVKKYSEERYLWYVFLRQSGKQRNRLKTNFENDFTTGDDHMPKKPHMSLHLLDKYTKNPVVIQPTS